MLKSLYLNDVKCVISEAQQTDDDNSKINSNNCNNGNTGN